MSTSTMFKILTHRNTNIFYNQKANSGSALVEYFYKYVLLPLSHECYCICQIIPAEYNVPYDSCFPVVSVIKFSTIQNFTEIVTLSTRPRIKKEISNRDIKVYNSDNIIEAKLLELDLVMKDDFDVEAEVKRWKCEKSLKTICGILKGYVVTHNSCILLYNTCYSNIAFISVRNIQYEGIAIRISHSTKLIVQNILPHQIFSASFKNIAVVGMDENFLSLNTAYEARKKVLALKANGPTSIIQKILVIGPSGCGKTSLVHALANKKMCPIISIEASELYLSNSSIRAIDEKFEKAIHLSNIDKCGMCILHFEQIDNVYHSSKLSSSNLHIKIIIRRLKALLENLINNLGVIFIATTHDINRITDLRTFFDDELFVNLPNKHERELIIKFYNPSYDNEVCKRLSSLTPAMTGEDLRFLSHEIGEMNNRQNYQLIDHWKMYLKNYHPTALKSGLGVIEIDDTTMDCLGGLNSIKQTLKSYIEWPIKHPDIFKYMNIRTPRGILLYGPPGCAKTSLARAVANSIDTHFLSISAAELYSAYVGETEKNVIQIFDKARINGPCILFIDEIDTLVGNRNTSSNDIQSKVLTTFLMEMDGVSGSDKYNEKVVIVVAATNRPNKIDPALLRPGRFDKLIYVGAPSLTERFDILNTVVEYEKIQLANCVNIMDIAKRTEMFSGADLKCLLNEAGFMALTECTSSINIKQCHIDEVLKKMKPSLKKEIYNLHVSHT